MNTFLGRIKSSGLGYKKVYNRKGVLIGYVRGRAILDADFNVWGLISSGGATNGKSYVKVQGGEAGYIDANNNILSARETYIGTIKDSKKIIARTFLVLLILTAFILSAYYSSFAMGTIGLRVYNPEYPTINVIQRDDNLSWSETSQLDILKDSLGNKIIFPGARGKYRFVIDNKNDQVIRCNILFDEFNEENLPMRYRLQSNNVYLSGHEDQWLTIEEVNTQAIYLAENSRGLFVLEWKWVTQSDEEDTAIGFRATATYTIIVIVNAELFNL